MTTPSIATQYNLNESQIKELDHLAKKVRRGHYDFSEEMKSFAHSTPTVQKWITTTHLKLIVEQTPSNNDQIKVSANYKYKIYKKEINRFFLKTVDFDSSYFRITEITLNDSRPPFWNISEMPPSKPNRLEIALPEDCPFEGVMKIEWLAQRCTRSLAWYPHPPFDGKEFQIIGPRLLPGQYESRAHLTYQIGLQLLSSTPHAANDLCLSLESRTPVPIDIPVYLAHTIFGRIKTVPYE